MFESVAQLIHRARKLIIAGTAIGFGYLAVLDFKGADILMPFVLAWLWLGGVVIFVETFHPELRARDRNIYDWDAPAWLKEVFQSSGYSAAVKVFHLFYFAALGFVTLMFVLKGAE